MNFKGYIVKENNAVTFFCQIAVSHTTDDLIFIWDPQMPLDVDKGIELPQLELISTKNDDCTTEYSTGKIFFKTFLKITGFRKLVHVVLYKVNNIENF